MSEFETFQRYVTAVGAVTRTAIRVAQGEAPIEEFDRMQAAAEKAAFDHIEALRKAKS